MSASATVPASMASGTSVDSVLRHPYLRQLESPRKRPRTSPLYLAVLVVVTGVMILLPLIYIALIGVVAYATWWHAVNDIAVFESVRNARAAVVAYVVPLAVGVIMILFMIKPLFAPRRIRYAPQALNRKDEPLLFAFVDRLSESVGAPRPSAIHIDMDMNASASFAGVFSGLIANKLVLTIGLPLAASMSVTQLTAVIAHEFGHFAQRSAMRMSYITRSISEWFARVVYERDGWDETLDNAISDGGHWGIQLIALIAKLNVWLSRRILWVLMVIGHFVSMVMSRQMEYDADRYSACVVGTRSAQDMLRRIPELAIAMNASYSQLDQAWAERRLPDNLPALVNKRSNDLPAEVRQQLKTHLDTEKTGWFSTHPSTRDRIRSLGKTPDDAAFDFPEAGAQLFTNFPNLCRIMTLQLYRDNLGPNVSQANLSTVEAEEKKREASVQQSEALERYTAGLVNPLRAIFFDDTPLSEDTDELAMQLMSVRNKFVEKAGDAKKAVEEWAEADKKLAELAGYIAAANAGVTKQDYRKLGLSSDEDKVLRQRKLQVESVRTSSRRKVDHALSVAMTRMRLALAIAEADRTTTEPVEESYDLADVTPANGPSAGFAVLEVLRSCFDQIEMLRQQFYAQQATLAHVDRYARDEHYVQAVISASRKQHAIMEQLRTNFATVAYPYTNGLALSQYVFTSAANAEDVGEVMQLADTALGNIYGLYMRVLADLVDRALASEAAIGLEPLTA